MPKEAYNMDAFFGRCRIDKVDAMITFSEGFVKGDPLRMREVTIWRYCKNVWAVEYNEAKRRKDGEVKNLPVSNDATFFQTFSSAFAKSVKWAKGGKLPKSEDVSEAIAHNRVNQTIEAMQELLDDNGKFKPEDYRERIEFIWNVRKRPT